MVTSQQGLGFDPQMGGGPDALCHAVPCLSGLSFGIPKSPNKSNNNNNNKESLGCTSQCFVVSVLHPDKYTGLFQEGRYRRSNVITRTERLNDGNIVTEPSAVSNIPLLIVYSATVTLIGRANLPNVHNGDLMMF